jgi:hypothetical protein
MKETIQLWGNPIWTQHPHFNKADVLYTVVGYYTRDNLQVGMTTEKKLRFVHSKKND